MGATEFIKSIRREHHLRERARHVLASSDETRVREYMVEAMAHEAEVDLHAVAPLEVIGSARSRPLALDLINCPFILRSVLTTPPGRNWQEKGALMVKTDDDQSRLCTLSFVARWRPDEVRFVRLPDDFPLPVREVNGEPVPQAYPACTVRVVLDERAPEMIVLGLGTAEPGEQPVNASFLRLCLLPQAAVGHSVQGGATTAVFTREALNALSRGSIETFASHVLNGREFLEGALGALSLRSVLVHDQSERRPRDVTLGGPAIKLDDALLRVGAIGSVEMQFEITRELASLYWGSGCRASGPHAIELFAALGTALALSWADASGHKWIVDRVLGRLRHDSRRAVLNDWSRTLAGEAAAGLAARLAEAIWKDVATGSGMLRLRRATIDLWGQVVPSKVWFRELGLMSYY